MTTKDPRFARWLKAARTARFPRAEDARAAYAEAGMRISPSQYASWESGGVVPKEDHPKRLWLYGFYGSRPEELPEPEADPLVTALGRQTQAIEALVGELRSARTEEQVRLAAMERAVDGLLETNRPGRGGRVSPKRPAPHRSTE
jgi:hypothetical protein